MTSVSVSVLGAISAVSRLRWLVSRGVAAREARVHRGDGAGNAGCNGTDAESRGSSGSTPELQRARLPLEVYPISAGVKGGLAGSVAMALLAMFYGIFSGHGIWYPINLLAAGLFPERATTAQISAFHWDMFLVAAIVHLLCSVLVGLLFGATLPMFPRRPILLGGCDRSHLLVGTAVQRTRGASIPS